MMRLVTTLTAAILVATSAAASPNTGLEAMTKQKLKEAGATAMIPIVDCESDFRHYDENGSLLRNPTVRDVVGIMQLREKYHPDPAIIDRYNAKHGTNLEPDDFNIREPEENVEYGIILYKVEGLGPWTECVG